MGARTAVEEHYLGTGQMNGATIGGKEVRAMMAWVMSGMAKRLVRGPKALAGVRRGFYAYKCD